MVSAEKLQEFRVHTHVALRIVRFWTIVLGCLDTDQAFVPAECSPGQHINFVSSQAGHRAEKEDLVLLGMLGGKFGSRAFEKPYHVEGRPVAWPVHCLDFDPA